MCTPTHRRLVPALGARAQATGAWEAVRELARARGVIGPAAVDAVETACGSYLTAATRDFAMAVRPDLAAADAHYAATQALTRGFMRSRARRVLAAVRAGLAALSDVNYVQAFRDFRRAMTEFPEFEALRAELDSMGPAAFVHAQQHAIMIAPRTPPRPLPAAARRLAL
jgi:hypothetical protein